MENFYFEALMKEITRRLVVLGDMENNDCNKSLQRNKNTKVFFFLHRLYHQQMFLTYKTHNRKTTLDFLGFYFRCLFNCFLFFTQPIEREKAFCVVILTTSI